MNTARALARYTALMMKDLNSRSLSSCRRSGGALRTAALALAMLSASGSLTGCIAWEIRDELRTANASLDGVRSDLDSVREGLTQTNELIAKVEHRLVQIDATNERLDSLQERLKLMQSINASLANLDLHLAALRRTIENIDSAIPFLKISEPEPEPPAAEGNKDADGAAVPSNPADSGSGQKPSDKP